MNLLLLLLLDWQLLLLLVDDDDLSVRRRCEISRKNSNPFVQKQVNLSPYERRKKMLAYHLALPLTSIEAFLPTIHRNCPEDEDWRGGIEEEQEGVE